MIAAAHQSHVTCHIHGTIVEVWLNKKLIYHKQIIHRLRTQHVEGICSDSMTLKSILGKLGVTQGQWK